MAKRNSAPKYISYPPHDDMRTGIKVSWYYYRDRAKADEAAKAARHNAEIQSSLGYDFGYQAPGSIVTVTEAYGMPERIGMFEVCIP